jgi:hypothetical protein
LSKIKASIYNIIFFYIKYTDKRKHNWVQQEHNEKNGASSDGELAKVGRRLVKNKKKLFFHEALDVDQLARYRRKRIVGQPQDQLELFRTVRYHKTDEKEEENKSEEQEKYKQLLTEYRLAFRTSSDNIFRVTEVGYYFYVFIYKGIYKGKNYQFQYYIDLMVDTMFYKLHV